jgi:hypothetical protein
VDERVSPERGNLMKRSKNDPSGVSDELTVTDILGAVLLFLVSAIVLFCGIWFLTTYSTRILEYSGRRFVLLFLVSVGGVVVTFGAFVIVAGFSRMGAKAFLGYLRRRR